MRYECKLCGGLLELLGQLGCLKWFRCRDCGMECSRQVRIRWRKPKATSKPEFRECVQ